MSDDFLNSINLPNEIINGTSDKSSSTGQSSLAVQRLKINQTKEKNNPRGLKPGPRVINPKKSTSFSLEVAIVDALERYVMKNGISKSQVVKQAIQQFLENDLKVEIYWDDFREKYE
ncbi:ribbon-helix-helix protein, CopG family [Bacillus sp. CGMCC 1.16541]|uniref:ribbon-helix-helix protein, CopG family n=1 Tax=Bacillus sp. CGMCC 1.16541 TaxID=2185143 RepID=UPI000D732FEA|nr:ribbon-helix-helix protein, CopG family [Bacillus sp. CGMCC 1.16541]